jgi:hypothetical protein
MVEVTTPRLLTEILARYANNTFELRFMHVPLSFLIG